MPVSVPLVIFVPSISQKFRKYLLRLSKFSREIDFSVALLCCSALGELIVSVRLSGGQRRPHLERGRKLLCMQQFDHITAGSLEQRYCKVCFQNCPPWETSFPTMEHTANWSCVWKAQVLCLCQTRFTTENHILGYSTYPNSVATFLPARSRSNLIKYQGSNYSCTTRNALKLNMNSSVILSEALNKTVPEVLTGKKWFCYVNQVISYSYILWHFFCISL